MTSCSCSGTLDVQLESHYLDWKVDDIWIFRRTYILQLLLTPFFPTIHLLPHPHTHPSTHPRDEPDIALELQRALSYAICQTDRVAAKTEFRRRRTGFMKDVRVTFKEVNDRGERQDKEDKGRKGAEDRPVDTKP